MRTIAIVLLLMGGGCEAAFTDLRPDAIEADSGEVDNDDQDMGSASDDTGESDDASTPDPDDDMSPGEDLGDGEDMPPAVDTVVASGMFVPRANYGGEGTAELVELADGSWELRIGPDFQVGSVPGPVVVLAREDSLGSTLDPARGDMELGVLETNNGASTYVLPAPPEDRRIVWIYCKPFGLQMTSAQLEDQ